MKRILLIILFISCKIIHSSDNTYQVKCRVAKRYAHYASLEHLYDFIKSALSWDRNGTQHGNIESNNTDHTKTLKITLFHENNTQPIHIIYWMDNPSQNSEFIKSSLWDDSSHTIPTEIDEIFNNYKNSNTDITSAEQQHLQLLQEIMHVQRTAIIDFVPLVAHELRPDKVMGQRRIRNLKNMDESDEEPTLIINHPTTSPFSSLANSASRSPDPIRQGR